MTRAFVRSGPHCSPRRCLATLALGGVCVVTAAIQAAPTAAPDAGDVVFRALRDELQRSMEKLGLEALDRPYFIAYRVVETDRMGVGATFGAAFGRVAMRQRLLAVELRVGSYEFDNTNFAAPFSFPGSAMEMTYTGSVALPLEDDYRELRRQIWLATDAAYKEALEQIAAKRAALQNKTRTEDVPDLSREPAAELREAGGRVAPDAAAAAKLVTDLSGIFRQMPAVLNSSVQYSARNVRVRYVNSEGSSFDRETPEVRLVALAATQADDGLPLGDFVTVHGRMPGDLPPQAELAAALRSMGERLAALRRAELLERYTGPVLFEGQAAAELLAQVFVPKLLVHRRPALVNERMLRSTGEEQDFQDRIGARVLPRFMSVTDDATRAATAAGMPLFGGYGADDQGVRARATSLVERGYLKTLLAGRTPVPSVRASTGSWRGGGVCPSNIFFMTDRALSAADLQQELMALIRDRGIEFGLVVRRLGTDRFGTFTDPSTLLRQFAVGGDEVSPCIAAYKVYPDGREVLLRNVEILGLTAASFKEVVAAGGETIAYTAPFSPAQTETPAAFFRRTSEEPPLVSLVAPSLLFEELTLKKPSGEIPKPPVLKHPYFAAKP